MLFLTSDFVRPYLCTLAAKSFWNSEHKFWWLLGQVFCRVFTNFGEFVVWILERVKIHEIEKKILEFWWKFWYFVAKAEKILCFAQIYKHFWSCLSLNFSIFSNFSSEFMGGNGLSLIKILAFSEKRQRIPADALKIWLRSVNNHELWSRKSGL